MSIHNLWAFPYHPEMNGFNERMKQMVLAMFRILSEKYKTWWKDHINKVIHAYNCTKYNSAGFLSYCFMFGCKPILRINIILQTEVDPPMWYAQVISRKLEGIGGRCICNNTSKLKIQERTWQRKKTSSRTMSW